MYKKVDVPKTSLETTVGKVLSELPQKNVPFSMYTNEFDLSMFRIFFPNNLSKMNFLNSSIAFVDGDFDISILSKHPITIIRNPDEEDIKSRKGEAEKIVKLDEYIVFYHKDISFKEDVVKEEVKKSDKIGSSQLKRDDVAFREENKLTHYKHISSVFPPKDGIDKSKLQITTVGVYSVTSYKANLEIVDTIKQKVGTDITIMDATACVGGDTIGFALNFNYVVSIEKDPINYGALTNNIDVYKLENVSSMNRDFAIDGMSIIADRKPDVVYFDPPWGGKDYHLHKELELYLNDTNIKDLVKTIIKHFDFVKMIVLKVPFNFNYKGLEDVGKVEVHKLRKFHVITIIR